MIGYVTVGTNDLKKAGEFYDKICGELGMGRFMAQRPHHRLGRRAAARALASRCPLTANR